jgi:Fe2+ or Zn2+ uptake regulation protein
VSAAEKQNELERFFAAHRECGLPITTQRRTVFEAILGRAGRPTAEQLYRAVHGELPQEEIL